MNDLLEKLVDIAEEAGRAILEIYQTDVQTGYKEDQSPLTQADLASHGLIVARLGALTSEVPVISEESKATLYAERRRWSRFWLVDPLDGTREFLKQNGEFTVNIALIQDCLPVLGVVYAPVLGVSYWAARGMGAFKRLEGEIVPIRTRNYSGGRLKVVASRSHAGAETEAFLANLRALEEVEVLSIGSSLKFCLVAEGEAHLYPRFGPTMEWDTAAAQCIVEEAGGSVTDFEDRRLLYNKENLRNPFFVASGPGLRWREYLPTAP